MNFREVPNAVGAHKGAASGGSEYGWSRIHALK